MPQELLQIGEFAKRTNTNLRTLRYYEEVGLIKPAQRSAGRFRLYSKDQIKRIDAVKRLQGHGLSLREIQELMIVRPEDGAKPTQRMAMVVDKQLDLVDRRFRALERERDELRAARVKLQQCAACDQSFGSDACVPCTESQPEVYSTLRSLV